MPARDIRRLRRFYARHPFGPVRGDLQAWLVARNAAEAWSGRLRSPDRAPLGLSKHRRIRPGRIKTAVTREGLQALSRELGVPFSGGA